MSWSTARPISLPDTAKLVRQALKVAYPFIKFSVRCERYSMGCSIDVHWTDGPTTAQVQPLLNTFDSQTFDGTDDSTHSHSQRLNGEEVRYEADYVKASRSISPAFLATIAAKVARQHGLPVPTVEKGNYIQYQGMRVPSTRYASGDEDLSDAIHHAAHQTSALPKPRVRVMPVVTETATA